ncbi:MAG: PilT/PilU family type 4a pilus ATPase [Candidatus Eremiobacteraeota bacterium]|nr:PilT/PilU family type 4a pilus ATPase [Candidatus Eremiobacteraeota bacterium]MCW5869915.1 PilT/PilU family type 4a pilus ATPase [Candidatus Eremiobacteraeota bacterium]
MEKRLQQLEDRLVRQERELQGLRAARPAVVSVEENSRGGFSGEVVRPPDLQFTLDDLLRVVINYNASDLHIKANAPPTVRLNGDLVPIGERPLTEQESLYLVMSSLPKDKRSKFNSIREIDAAYVSRGVRFRLNAFLERGRVSGAFRMVSTQVPNFETLGLPPVLARLSNMYNGLVLVTGPAGSGKSTTLAAVIDWINRNRRAHIVTIEDPIEYYHHDIHSFVSQREIGTDTSSFAEALRQALRQDPNVIMVGEMRDVETIMTAVTAAETGHLVLSTLHTPNTVQSIDRILDTFSGDQQKQIRMLLSSCLRGVVSQKLLQRIDGKGRVPAVEVLVCTSTVQSLILEGNTKEIYPYIQQGGSEGMQTFTTSLTRLLEQGLVSREEAAFHAEQSTEFRLANRHNEHPRSGATPSGSYLNWL